MKQGSGILFMVMLLAALIFSGCESSSNLKVVNNTNGDLNINLDGSEKVLRSGESTAKSWELNDWLLSHETKNISVSGDGEFKMSFEYHYEIKPDKDKIVDIDADVGVVWFHNNSELPICEVYISTPESPIWGADQLDESIASGDSCFWQVESGYRDFALVDTYGHTWAGYSFLIEADQRYDFYLLSSAVNSSLPDSPYNLSRVGQLPDAR
jgi:hypothetical protein